MSDLKDPRVLFAAERTLLAWNRTSLALIAFGFMVERTGILIRIFAPQTESAYSAETMFWVGLAFLLVGAFAAAYSSRQYLQVLKSLTPAEFPPGYTARWGVLVNLLVAVLGVCLTAALFLGNPPK